MNPDRLGFIQTAARVGRSEEHMPTVSLENAVDLFGTSLFRDSPYVSEIAREVGKVYVTTDPEQPGHFGAYFGYMLNPDLTKYPNPHIRDLRILHDLTHILCWKRDPFPKDGTFFGWTKRMIDAEIYASLVTECFVYFKIPGLREQTFQHEIWVDRFLRDPSMRVLTPMLEYRIAAARFHAMTTPDPSDLIELGIANYLKQNRDWCVLWGKPVSQFSTTPAFRVVEDHMRLLYAGKVPLEHHIEWLKHYTVESPAPFPEPPFTEQARAFQPVYQKTSMESGVPLLRV
jgi:hypothetical protein